ncbi:MAG: DoxX family protein [Saprospiraceae bacterium]|nr:DoxX family protein [Saprospiraceae bacterium]
MLRKLISTSDDSAIFVVRIVLGTVILAHGLQKLFGWFGGHGVSWTLEAWQKWWGLPPVITMLVILGESFGALALIIGLGGRFMAASIGIIMFGAMYLVNARWGFFMNWYSEPQRGEGFELHLLVLGMVIAILMKGSGRWSLDRWLQQKYFSSDIL